MWYHPNVDDVMKGHTQVKTATIQGATKCHAKLATSFLTKFSIVQLKNFTWPPYLLLDSYMKQLSAYENE